MADAITYEMATGLVERLRLQIFKTIYNQHRDKIDQLYKDDVCDWCQFDPGEFAMKYGPAHIVWADGNYERKSVQFCLDHWAEYDGPISENALCIVKESLVKLMRFHDRMTE